MMILPVLLTWLMASVFGGGGKDAPDIVLHVAVVDDDEDFFSGMLRSISSQGDAGKNLKLHFVDDVDQGILLLEKRRASALVVFPDHMTADLVDGATVTIELYKNPAQLVLPIVVEQGTDLFAVGISQLIMLMEDELRQTVELLKSDALPSSWGTAMLLYNGMEKIRVVEKYFLPPLVQFKTIAAKDFIPSASREQVIVQ
jgi:ABC-2 family transporter protein